MNILRRVDEKREIFKITKQMTRIYLDVVGEKYIRNDHGDLAFGQLLNEEYEWDTYILLSADPILGPSARIKR